MERNRLARVGLPILALLAAFLQGADLPSKEADAFTGAQASCLLDRDPALPQGVEHQAKNGESQNAFVERAGRKAWREMKMMYFLVKEGALKAGKAPLVRFEVDYFDEGQGVVALKYDSSDRNVGSGDRLGVWKTKRAFTLTGSGAWKTARFKIPDAYFAGRCNGGDFRFESKAGLTLAKLRLTAADAASQAANQVALSNAPPAPKTEAFTLSLDEVWAKAKRFDGPVATGSDPSTLTGKVMCGYQGWQGVPGDGSGLGWVHWAERGTFEPGDCHVDYWPDLSEADADEKIPTPFRRADGSVAHVFTAMNPKTVDRHFRWMETHGIDGVFLQRFATGIKNPGRTFKNNTVLEHVRSGANAHGRTWALMYDLSGARDTQALLDDFKRLVDREGLGKDPRDKAYQRHKGKPVLALWGLFADREYCLDAFEKMMDLAQRDPVYGGFAIKLGTENGWRSGTKPNHDRVRALCARADIISPWTVGRYGGLEQAELFIRHVQIPDLAWCAERKKDYMPVIFPGFSWANMNDGTRPLDQIPRLQGRFFWRQAAVARECGASMLYVAMFDEIDEGTAIYKVDNDPPVCPDETTRFLTYQGLPNDHYLWLAGQAKKLLDGSLAPQPLPPARPGFPVAYRPLYSNQLPSNLRELSAVFSDPPAFRGLVAQAKGSEIANEPCVRAGRPGWLLKPVEAPEKMRKFYLKLEHEAFCGKEAPPVSLELDLYSPTPAGIKVVYDSRDFSIDAHGTSPGAWKVAETFRLEGSGAWTTHRFEIRDGLFIGRCNGNDLRVEVDPGADVVIGAIRLKRLD
ncbi:MAG: hypothetical protein J0L75_02275 [Spirochaetes bacterium]|nr:hypothetical protein [Spirochaetota bacterium]